MLKGRLETSNELATKAAPQHREGKKEARAGSNPARVVERESAGRDDTVNMGMKLKLLVPGMQASASGGLAACVIHGLGGDRMIRRMVTAPGEQSLGGFAL